MMAAMATTRRADMFTADGKPSDDDPREHGTRLGDERATLAADNLGRFAPLMDDAINSTGVWLAPWCLMTRGMIDYRVGRHHGPDGVAARLLWKSVDRMLVHTELERQDLVQAFGLRPERIVVTEHGAHFVRRSSLSTRKSSQPRNSWIESSLRGSGQSSASARCKRRSNILVVW